ncbi:hypothetical protein QE385_000264 [Sphingomonas sp. SORGH_AS 950]|nr:hypothetical protein [Sphingomonas sp. SORGH_AS_0950]
MNGTTTVPAMETLRQALGMEEPDPVTAGADDATRLACWMLNAIRPWPEAARNVMQALLMAHREGRTGSAEWRNLRAAAVALSDDRDAEVRAFGHVAEAAAWPLATARAGLVEMMQAICQLRAQQMARATGWTEEDEQAAHVILMEIEAGDGRMQPRREDIPALFMAANPGLEKRFCVNLTAANAAFSAFKAEVAAWIAGATR